MNTLQPLTAGEATTISREANYFEHPENQRQFRLLMTTANESILSAARDGLYHTTIVPSQYCTVLRPVVLREAIKELRANGFRVEMGCSDIEYMSIGWIV